MTAAWLPALVALGWVAHLADWLLAVRRRRGRVAHRGEWTRELLVRLTMLGLVLWAITRPGAPPRPAVAVLAVALVWGGTALAVLGRRQLGSAWGIGVRPHGAATASGVYGAVRHPIYLGTCAALFGQWLALRNVPAVLLLGGALLVIPLKIAWEGAALRDAAPPGT